MLNDRLVMEHTLLQESFATLLEGAEKGSATQDTALAHITERSQELATKLAAAEVRLGHGGWCGSQPAVLCVAVLVWSTCWRHCEGYGSLACLSWCSLAAGC